MEFEKLLKESKRFEFWAKRNGFYVEKTKKPTEKNGIIYRYPDTSFVWQGWLASAEYERICDE